MTSELALVHDPEHAPGSSCSRPSMRVTRTSAPSKEGGAGLAGWVFAAARARDLIGTLAVPVAPELELEVYDGISPRPEALLYDSAPSARAGAGLDRASR